MKSLLGPLLALVLLAGCASRQDYEAYVATFVNRTEAELVRELGVPSRTYEVQGSRFLAYSSRRVDVIDGYRPGWGYGRRSFYDPWRYDRPVVQEWVCETTFEVRDERVVAWTVRGNGCVA